MSNTPSAIMIFAAGFGTRMRPLTKDKPKPMVEVAGSPMIDRALSYANEVNAQPIVCNLHYKGEVLEEHLKTTGVVCIWERPDILDTGGGLRNAQQHLGSGPVMTMNPDAIWHGPNPLTLVMQNWEPTKMDALLLCVPSENARGTQSHGDFTLQEDGQIRRGKGVLYGGVQIIKMSCLSLIPQTAFSLNSVWDKLISSERCFGCNYPGEWCDVGHPEGIKTAEDMIGWPSDA